MSTAPASGGVKRRDFLKVLGATGAATAAVGCGTDHVERLIPYLASPDQTVPGVSTYYATTCRECSAGCGVIAETRDGRTIKLEGNPEHPVNRGALCARGQAALQGLYNPDRFRGPMIRQGHALVRTTWDVALQRFEQMLAEARPRGAAGSVFINQHESGSFPALLDRWLAQRGLGAHLSYDAEAPTAVLAANRQAYGVAWPRLDFAAARLIVSLGADFLDGWGASVPQQLDFADARAKLENAPRFIYVGARRSLTGLNADEWIACRPGGELAVAQALFGAAGGNAGLTPQQAADQSGVPAEKIDRLVREFQAAKPSLVLAGAGASNAGEVALQVAAVNQRAGNVGATVRPAEPLTSFDRIASHADLRTAIQRMNEGGVLVFMVRGANPAHTMPTAAGFAQALAKVQYKVSFSSYPDETTELCDLVLPDHHPLESWGDSEPLRGVLSLQQPAMDPVFDTRATADVLLRAGSVSSATRSASPKTITGAESGGGSPTDYRGWLAARFPGDVTAFTAALARGVASGSALQSDAPPPAVPQIQQAPVLNAAPAALAPDFYHLTVYRSAVLGDGRGGNKPWLQELPDPVTKISWQSWVELHPSTARKLGVANGDHVTVQTDAGRLTAPAFVYLGIRPDTVAIATGRGHTAYGRYARGIGANPMDILPSAEDSAGGLALSATRARIAKAEGHSPLVTTEGSARQHGRGVAQAVSVDELSHPGTARESTGAEHAEEIAPQGTEGASRGTQPRGHVASGGRGEERTEGGEEHIAGDASHGSLPGLRSPVAADAQGELGSPSAGDRGTNKGMYARDHWSGMANRRWAMTIDLARCTGCSACVTACYAENNIPTVGAPWQGRALGPTTPHAGPWDTRPGANILKGREMNWIRLERYFEGGEDGTSDFETRFIPMLCQHCGNAPCEPVCPVYATYHSPDGLNVQVYNRCVGTRYCSNNCPYKVRYFNWFGYGEPERRQYAFPEPLNWQLNPDVTVRGKGVMEKCTFCVQRIREAENRAVLEQRAVQPDEFTVACAQACPSRAITFGDAADPDWSVSKVAQDRRAYHVFEELNTYTAVVYLKKVNHPQPAAAPGAV